MDPSSLKLRAAGRRSTATPTVGWKCDYCRKQFVLEKAFMQHNCNGKRRLEQIQSPIGQAAYASYSTWMKQQKRTVPNIDTFMTSRQYVAFIKFAEYCKRLSIDADNFIKVILTNAPDIKPNLWCRDNVYSLYLRFYDQSHDPFDQVADSIEFINKHAEREGCFPAQVLETLGFPIILEAIKLKKLSPWFIFTSSVGLHFLRSLAADDYRLVESAINAAVWGDRFSENEALVAELQAFTESIGL